MSDTNKKAIRRYGEIEYLTFEEVHEMYQKLLYSETRRYRYHHLYDDIFQMARIGLWRAYRVFDAENHAMEFVAHATQYIKYSIFNFLNKFNPIKLPKDSIVQYVDSLEDLTDAREGDDYKIGDFIVDEDVNIEEDSTLNLIIGKMYEQSNKRRREIMRMIMEGYGISEISRELGISRQTIYNNLNRIKEIYLEGD